MSLSRERKQERMMSGLPDTLEASTYNLVIGLCLLYGFFMNAVIVGLFHDFFCRINPIVFVVLYFVCVIAGTVCAASSDVKKSFLGYNLIVLPIGALLSTILPYYGTSLILRAMLMTGAITLMMMAIATLKPNWFAHLGRVLGISLMVLVGVSLISLLFGFEDHDAFAYIGAAVFTLYIGYDWYKAQAYPKTLDNAVDSALDLYLDIINLFIKLLRILAKAQSDD